MSATAGQTGWRAQGWDTQRERGSLAMLRLMLWITLRVGFSAGQILVYPIALYFYATSSRARAASRDFLGRVGVRPGWTAVLRHIHSFSAVIFERVYLLANRLDGFEIDVRGLDTLKAVLAQNRGCVLLGAHFGSFEVMRIVGRLCPVAVRPMMYRGNTGNVTKVLEGIDPVMQAAIIHIGQPDTMLRIRDSLAAGEIVGMLADRSAGGGKLIDIPFLGGTAQFPTGPLIAIASLEAPALLFYGIRTGPRRYIVRFEPFADRITLPRATRREALHEWVTRFAAALEVECRHHPYNWFNFYPFWERHAPSPDPAADRRAAGNRPVAMADPGAGSA